MEIFDSLTHPMPDGTWISGHGIYDNNINKLMNEMVQYNIKWALAVGMGGEIGGYELETYSDYIRSNSNNLYPVAFLDPKAVGEGGIKKFITRVKRSGYIGIKIHPRFANLSYSDGLLHTSILEANNQGIVPLLCSYHWGSDKKNSVKDLHELISSITDEKLIIVHGGVVHLMEISEAIKHSKNVLLDLSYTMTKYEGSSLDFDIKFLMQNLDKKLVVGSDSPEISIKRFRDRFETLSENLDDEKKVNIANKNLREFLGIRV